MSIARQIATMPAAAIDGEIVDFEAAAIGDLYAKARTSIVDSVRYQIECGQRLAAKKTELGHGQWLPWLKANAGVLGFDTPRTAQMLIKSGNTKLTSHLDAASAIQISRQAWGNSAPVRGTAGTGENEWYTPSEHLDLAREVLNEIDLDPASSHVANRAVKAKQFFSQETNGLDREWAGKIWLNPPYAQPAIAQFAEKMVSEWKSGRVEAAIVLTHNYTDTAWFQGLARAATAICFTRGRVRFVSPEGDLAAPTQGQAFFYFGPDIDIFADVFGEVGFVAVLHGEG